MTGTALRNLFSRSRCTECDRPMSWLGAWGDDRYGETFCSVRCQGLWDRDHGYATLSRLLTEEP